MFSFKDVMLRDGLKCKCGAKMEMTAIQQWFCPECKSIIDTPETQQYIKKLSERGIEVIVNDFIPPEMLVLEDSFSDKSWLCKRVKGQVIVHEIKQPNLNESSNSVELRKPAKREHHFWKDLIFYLQLRKSCERLQVKKYKAVI